MGLFVFVLLVFPKVFTKPKNPSRKPKIQKKNQRKPKNIRNNQKPKFLKVSASPLDMGFVFLFLGFPEGFYKTKNFRENQKYKRKPNNIKQTLGKPSKQSF